MEILSYGQGHAPASSELLAAVQHFTRNGGLLLNISQAHHGRTGTAYAQSNALRQAGAVGGGKCNIETATALMTLAAGNRWTASQLQQALQELGLAWLPAAQRLPEKPFIGFSGSLLLPI